MPWHARAALCHAARYARRAEPRPPSHSCTTAAPERAARAFGVCPAGGRASSSRIRCSRSRTRRSRR
eukprot:171009-Prymnesium_polylepis.1